MRVTTGAYILHSGLEKWNGDEQTAGFLHGAAITAFPQFKGMRPAQFLKLLAACEISLGTALLLPLFPARLAGLGLTAFSGALLKVYANSPALRKPGSIWPSHQGIAMSKDVWMLGIGLSLVLDSPDDD